jgi:hypothetical protein
MNTKIVTMTVLELIARLGKFPLEAPVIVASSEQNNSFLGLNILELDESGSVILWPDGTSTNPGSTQTK